MATVGTLGRVGGVLLTCTHTLVALVEEVAREGRLAGLGTQSSIE